MQLSPLLSKTSESPCLIPLNSYSPNDLKIHPPRIISLSPSIKAARMHLVNMTIPEWNV